MARAFFLVAALMLIGVATVSQAFSVKNLESNRLQHLSRRAKRSTEKQQFVCVLPINETANNPYIHCGVINETESQYSMPVDLSDRYRPKFEYALLCSNLTIVEDEEEAEDGDEDDDSSSSSSEEDTHESDSDESGEDLCLRGSYHDCSVQCVYRESNVLNEAGLPEPEPLFEHVIQLLNRDGEFQKPVKDAVKTCHKKMIETIHKYGLERLNMCLLLEIVDECLEFEIGLHCPKRSRIPYKKS